MTASQAYGRTVQVERVAQVARPSFHAHPDNYVQDVDLHGLGGRLGIIRYTGPCLVCNRTTWLADGDHNDPRGVLGLHVLWVTEGPKREPLRLCGFCGNDGDAYREALKKLALHGARTVAPWRCVLPHEA